MQLCCWDLNALVMLGYVNMCQSCAWGFKRAVLRWLAHCSSSSSSGSAYKSCLEQSYCRDKASLLIIVQEPVVAHIASAQQAKRLAHLPSASVLYEGEVLTGLCQLFMQHTMKAGHYQGKPYKSFQTSTPDSQMQQLPRYHWQAPSEHSTVRSSLTKQA